MLAVTRPHKHFALKLLSCLNKGYDDDGDDDDDDDDVDPFPTPLLALKPMRVTRCHFHVVASTFQE